MKKNTIAKPFSELHKIALKEARKIHRARIEHGIAIDEFGNIFSAIGDGDEVTIPDYMLENCRIVIHNHPNDVKEPSSFSGTDVYNLLHYGLDEIIVCGYGCYFYMRNNGCKTRAIDMLHKLNSLYENVSHAQTKKYAEKSVNLEMPERRKMYRESLRQTEVEYHKELKSLSSEKGLSYGRYKL